MRYVQLVDNVAMAHFAQPQVGIETVLMDECPGIGYVWDGQAWSEPVPTEDVLLKAQVAAIKTKYDAKAALLKDRLAIIQLKDGVVESEMKVALSQEWDELLAQKKAEEAALMGD